MLKFWNPILTPSFNYNFWLNGAMLGMQNKLETSSCHNASIFFNPKNAFNLFQFKTRSFLFLPIFAPSTKPSGHILLNACPDQGGEEVRTPPPLKKFKLIKILRSLTPPQPNHPASKIITRLTPPLRKKSRPAHAWTDHFFLTCLFLKFHILYIII